MKDLFESGYEGIIIESGLGVPLQAQILSYSGASNFLLKGESPYNNAFQPQIGYRSVSEEMAVAMAREGFAKLTNSGFPRAGKKLFSAAITGTHSQSGQSHGWMCVLTEDHTFIVHFIVAWSSTDRFTVVGRTGQLAITVLNAALNGKNLSENHSDTIIDVIRWPNMSILDKLNLCRHDYFMHSLYFDEHGDMQRPTDIVRKTNTIYRGSFNPPTKAHLKIGDDALFEITGCNTIKGYINNIDLSHRINMLNRCQRGVLITDNTTFDSLTEYLVNKLGANNHLRFIVGMDTFNRICEDTDKNYNGILKKVKFIVNNRHGLSLNKKFQMFNIEVKDYAYDDNSTEVRKGNHTFILLAVSQYIKAYNLYK